MSRTGSNNESNRVESRVEQGRNIILGRGKSQHGSREAEVMELLSDFFVCISVIQT